MQLDIILRTHDGDSVHPRRFDKPKKDIVWRCIRSLCKAIKNVPKPSPKRRGYNINLTIIDDHSSNETKDFLYKETYFLGNRITITPLEETGNNTSMLAALTMARDSGADLVYVVEDDYLHYPNSLKITLETWHHFYPKSPFELMGLSLVDCASNYAEDGRDGSQGVIMGGTDRPWRSINHTGVTFMLERGIIQKHWKLFEEIARYWPYLEEKCTFNKLWNKEVGMFCPLVPLAYHLWEDHPFYPVKQLWRDNHVCIN